MKRPQSARKPPWASWSRTGKNWHHATIRGIICNLTYTGVLCSGKSRSQVLPHLQLISQDRWTVSFVWKCILRPLWGAAGPLQHKTKISFPKKRDFCITLVIGGDKRDRTADLLNAIQALSQLSYTPTFIHLSVSAHFLQLHSTGIIISDSFEKVNTQTKNFYKIFYTRNHPTKHVEIRNLFQISTYILTELVSEEMR